MKIIITNSYEEMSKTAAKEIAMQILTKPDSVIGFATGSTPLGLYKELIRYHKEGIIDFSQITAFNLDEYIGLDRSSDQSYVSFMADNLFDAINLPPENRNIPSGIATDMNAECLRYEKAIETAGGIDIQILGIGRNGHIGFNEPGTPFDTITHTLDLTEETISDNTRFFEKKNDVPTRAISMGMKTIMRARKILLLASGENKRAAIRGTINGKISTDLPASVLQLHCNAVVITDKEAGNI